MINQTEDRRGAARRSAAAGTSRRLKKEEGKKVGRVEPDSRRVRSTFVAVRRKAKAGGWAEATVEIPR